MAQKLLFWNTDVSKFLHTAFEVQQHQQLQQQAPPTHSIHESMISSFVETQELVENEQDLVLYRGNLSSASSSNDASGTRMQPASSQDVLIQQWQKKGGGSQQLQIRQVYISFWPAACLFGMIIVLLQFMVFYRGERTSISGMQWSQQGMTKHAAMLLAFCYSALAWTLSNGLVANPRKNIASGYSGAGK